MESMKMKDEKTKEMERSFDEDKLKELITSIEEKVEGFTLNFLLNINEKKILVTTQPEKATEIERKMEKYSELIQNTFKVLLEGEGEPVAETIFLLENSFLLFLKISEGILWGIKANDVNKVGMVKMLVEKTKEEIKNYLE